jgi:hypothetical protein
MTEELENPPAAPDSELVFTPPPPPEDFPELIECPHCKRPYRTQQLRTHVNTLLTEIALSCHRCKKNLRRMKLKDWYDHYVQGQPHAYELDRHGFVHKDPRDILQPPAPKTNPLAADASSGRPSGPGGRPDGRPPSRNHRRRGNRTGRR